MAQDGVGLLFPPPLPPKKVVSKLDPHLSDRLQIQGKDERGSVRPQTEKEDWGAGRERKERKEKRTKVMCCKVVWFPATP